MTRTQRQALEWFARQQEPVGLFGYNDPSPVIIKRLAAQGLIERVHDPRPVAFVRYRISAMGRTVLSAANP